MPGGGFDVQRAVVVSRPLAGPGLAHVGGCQRRPYRRGWLEFGHVQAGGGEERAPIRRRSLSGRIFSLRRKRLKVGEPALWIELDVDHARHGGLGIVLPDARPESTSRLCRPEASIGSGLWRYQNFSGDGRLRAISSHCGKRPVGLFHRVQKIVVVIEGVSGVARRVRYSRGAGSTPAPCRRALRGLWSAAPSRSCWKSRPETQRPQDPAARRPELGTAIFQGSAAVLARGSHHLGRRCFTGGERGSQRIAAGKTGGHGESGRGPIGRLRIEAAKNGALNRRVEFLHQRRRAYRSSLAVQAHQLGQRGQLRRRVCR